MRSQWAFPLGMGTKVSLEKKLMGNWLIDLQAAEWLWWRIEKRWLETQFLAAHCTTEGTPQDPRPVGWEPFCWMIICQMHWGYLILACLGLYLWLSLMRTSLSFNCHLFPIPAPYSLPHVPAPVCPPISAPSAHSQEVNWQWSILLEWASGFFWQLSVNRSFAELIFNALSFAYRLSGPDTWLWKLLYCSVISVLTSECFPFSCS